MLYDDNDYQFKNCEFLLTNEMGFNYTFTKPVR